MRFTMITHLRSLKSLRILTGVTSVVLLGVAGALYAMPPTVPPMHSSSPTPGAPPPPGATAAKPVELSDVALARAILAAFDADPTLKDVNIVVSVVDRVAVIGGPVNSAEVMKHAEQVVRRIPGIESVKNTCFVLADPDPLLRAVANQMKPGAKPTGSAALPGVAIPPSAPEGFLPPVPPPPPSDLLAVGSTPNTVVAQKPLVLPVGPAIGVLGAPVSPGSGAVTSPVPLPAPGPAALTGSTSAKPGDLQAGITAIRTTDKRFDKLTVEVKPDGGLFVSGSAAKPADVWDFAAEVRKLPGVTRVAVDPNLVK